MYIKLHMIDREYMCFCSNHIQFAMKISKEAVYSLHLFDSVEVRTNTIIYQVFAVAISRYQVAIYKPLLYTILSCNFSELV